jgi:hypothetical protein
MNARTAATRSHFPRRFWSSVERAFQTKPLPPKRDAYTSRLSLRSAPDGSRWAYDTDGRVLAAQPGQLPGIPGPLPVHRIVTHAKPFLRCIDAQQAAAESDSSAQLSG